MKPSIVGVLLLACAVAPAEAAPSPGAPGDRCTAGVAYERRGELSRAALYLDACDDSALSADVARTVAQARRELRKKLEDSSLSVLEVVSRPAGLDAEIDALPGEHFTTPATIYVPAGVHQVRAGSVTNKVETKPRARTVIYLDAGVAKAPGAPRSGKVDFNEDAGGEATQQVAPPPEAKHPPMMPCRYTNSCTTAGEQIDDPLARHDGAPPPYPYMMLELRAGSAYTSGVEPELAVSDVMRAPWEDRSATRPFVFAARAGWTRRSGASSYSFMDTIGKVIAAPDTAWVILGVGGVYDSVSGAGGSALVDISLRRLPLSIAAEYEYAGRQAVFVELGVGFRHY